MNLLPFLFIFISMSPIKSLEKEAKSSEKLLLVPPKVGPINYYAGVKIYDSPDGKVKLEMSKGVLVSALKKRVVKNGKKWRKIIITTPWYSAGWVREEALGKILTTDSYFYSKPQNSISPSGWIKQGVIVRVIKKLGDFSLVKFHHYVPIKVYVKTKNIGTSFGKYVSKPFKYRSKYNRYLRYVKKGPIFSMDKKTKIAQIDKKTKFKVDYVGKKWSTISSPSYYDMKFRGTVPTSRVGKKTFYYYSYSYYFRLTATYLKSWLQGSYVINKDVSLYSSSTSETPFAYLKKGSKISTFNKISSGIYLLVFARKNYLNSYYSNKGGSLTNLLDLFEGTGNNGKYYFSTYEKIWEIKGYSYLEFLDISPLNK